MSMSHCILLDHAHIGDQHIPTLVDSILLVYKIMSSSRCILLYHAHIGNQHIIPSFVDSIHLVLRDDEHVTLQTPRSCPHSRSTHIFLRRFILLSNTRFMITPRCILLLHADIGDQSIVPSFIDSIRLVLQDYEHVTLHTPRSCPHRRSTHPFLRRFDSHTTRRLWARCILLNLAHIGDQPNVPSFVDFICLVLQDHEHVTLHIFQSCPHWTWTHPFLRWFDLLSTTWSWVCHIAYSSIMPTLEINTSLPSSIHFS
jgi:hypothetical protein